MNKLPSSRNKGTTSTEPASRALVSEIRFYRANEKPYGAFSNLYRRPGASTRLRSTPIRQGKHQSRRCGIGY